MTAQNPLARPPHGWDGALSMTAAMGFWAGNDALIKACTPQMGTAQIMTVRGVFAVVLALTLLLAARQVLPRRLLFSPAVLLRCALELATAASSITALSLAPLSVVTALMMTAPLLAMLGVVILGWERWSLWRLQAALAGLVGALLVVQPWRVDAPPMAGVLAALGCALCLAARDLSTRRVASLLTARQLTLATSTCVWLAGVGLWVWAPQGLSMAMDHLYLLAAAAVSATADNLLLVRALSRGEVGRIMPLRFTLLLWSSLLGFLVWHEKPSPLAWLGLGLIAAAGVASLSTRAVPPR